MFSARVNFYDELDNKESYAFCMIPGNDFHEALSSLENYYGIDNLIRIDLTHISPDNLIVFESMESVDLFNKVENYIKENVIW